MGWDKERAVRNLYALGNLVVRIVGCVIFLCLARYSFRYTQYMLPGGRELSVDVLDSRSGNILGLAVAAGIMAVLLLVERYVDRGLQYILCRCSLVLTLVWFTVAGMWWIGSSAHIPVGDPAFIYGGASYFIEGNYDFLSTGGYHSMHPHQMGLTAIYELLFRVVGTYNYHAVEMLNLFFALGSIYLGYRILSEITGSTAAIVGYNILMLGCLPLIFYTPWVYGDIPSIFFALLVEWALLRYLAERRNRHLVLMALALMLALLVRKNSLILLVAVGLTVLLHALLHRDMRIVLAFLLGAVLCYGSYEAVWKIYEIRSGYENDGGIPIIAWVTMGMMENYGAYGWYNNYPKEVFYGEAAGSREAVSAIAKRDLKKRLRAFADDWGYAVHFFKGKLLSQWNEPLYQALYFNAESPESEDGPAPDSLAARLYGEDYFKALHVCDRWQFIMYVGMLCYFLLAVKKDSPILQHVLAVTIIGGFFFSIIYEAKARYICPYYVMMFPYATYGYRLAVSQIMAMAGKHMKGRRVVDIEEGRKAA